MFENDWTMADRRIPASHPRRMNLNRPLPFLVGALSGVALAFMPTEFAFANGNASDIDHVTQGNTHRPVADRSPSKEVAPIKADVRYASGDKWERLVIEFDDVVQHVAKLDGDQLILWLDRAGTFNLESLALENGDRLRDFEAVGGEATRWIILHLAPNSGYKSLIGEGGRKLTIDLASLDELGGTQQVGINRSIEKQRKTVASNGHLDDHWVPRKRPILEPASPTAKYKAKRTEHGNGQAQASALSRALTKYVQQAGSNAKTDADVKAVTKPAAEAGRPPRSSGTAPGQFDVDENALDRALERTLTREGAVLLPFGMVEIEPSVSYVRREFDAPTLINLFGFAAFGETVVRRNEINAILAARAGLPIDSQIELDVPYRYVDQSETTMIGFGVIDETDSSATAFGDIGIGVAKTLLREGDWWPDMVARVRWDSATGKTAEDDVALGGGAHEVTGSISVVKSQDPLAFFGSLAYEKTFEENDIDRGDRIGLTAGTVLAASPDTSLRASIQQDFIGDAEIDGDEVAGSDRMAATLRLGASSVLGQGVLLDASVDVGLTDDAPDYAARVSLPIRFNPAAYWAFGDQSVSDEDDEAESKGGDANDPE